MEKIKNKNSELERKSIIEPIISRSDLSKSTYYDASRLKFKRPIEIIIIRAYNILCRMIYCRISTTALQ